MNYALNDFAEAHPGSLSGVSAGARILRGSATLRLFTDISSTSPFFSSQCLETPTDTSSVALNSAANFKPRDRLLGCLIAMGAAGRSASLAA